LPFCKKGEKVQPYLEKIQNILNDLQNRLLNKACRTLLSPQEVSWWEAFFEEQKYWNALYLVQNRRLKFQFLWPIQSNSAETIVEKIHADSSILDEEKINLRVYGKSCDIYVGGYKNQKLIKLEKKKHGWRFPRHACWKFYCGCK
jgi:hypothetical protein